MTVHPDKDTTFARRRREGQRLVEWKWRWAISVLTELAGEANNRDMKKDVFEAKTIPARLRRRFS